MSHADGALSIQFTNGSTFVIERTHAGLAAPIIEPDTTASADEPSRRQREYLEFIRKYMARYGVAPAESDIQLRCLVSAPGSRLARTQDDENASAALQSIVSSSARGAAVTDNDEIDCSDHCVDFAGAGPLITTGPLSVRKKASS